MVNCENRILELNHGECWIWPEGDYGKAEIWHINDVYILFEIPMYGGRPAFHKAYGEYRLDELIETVESWT